jgi:hypothetical protein
MLRNRQPASAALENEVLEEAPLHGLRAKRGLCTVLALSDALADDERGEVVLNA